MYKKKVDADKSKVRKGDTRNYSPYQRVFDFRCHVDSFQEAALLFVLKQDIPYRRAVHPVAELHENKREAVNTNVANVDAELL